MGWAGGITVFFVTWWLVIFMVLPWGVQAIDQEDVEKGQSRGAPKKPLMIRKFVITTVITTILWGIAYLLIDSGMLSFRE
jgi:predicted secreted protein